MYVWAEVTPRAPLCLVWQPRNHHTAAGKTLLDLPDTQNHYVVFVMEWGEKVRRKEKEKRKVYFCLRKTLRGLKFGHSDMFQTSFQT